MVLVWAAFFSRYKRELIAPEKYAPDNRGFDTRISLEKLHTLGAC